MNRWVGLGVIADHLRIIHCLTGLRRQDKSVWPVFLKMVYPKRDFLCRKAARHGGSLTAALRGARPGVGSEHAPARTRWRVVGQQPGTLLRQLISEIEMHRASEGFFPPKVGAATL